MKSYLSSLFVALILSSGFLLSQDIKTDYNLDKLDAYFEKSMQDWKIPGMAIAIVKDGKVIHSKGYGIKDIRTNEPVDENTIFGIASNSKAFTSAVVLSSTASSRNVIPI